MTRLFNITFADPWWFLLGLIIPVLVWWYVKRYKKNKVTLVLTQPPTFKLPVSIKARLRHLPFIFRMIGLMLLISAMARPQGFIGDDEMETEGIDIVFAFDVSYSMVAKDLEPSRFDVARRLMIDFISSRKNDRFGLVVFGATAISKTPLTLDHKRLINRINNLEPGPGEMGYYTAIGLGLGTAVARLQNSEAKSKVIILITDGVNNYGEVSPLVAADLAASFGIRTYIIGVGTRGKALGFGGVDFNGNIIYQYQNVEIDEPVMNKIALTTGGKYFRATDNTSLENIFKEIDVLEKSKLKAVEIMNKPDKFWYLVALAGVILFLEFVLRITYFKSIV